MTNANPAANLHVKPVDIDDNGNAPDVELSRSAQHKVLWISHGPKFTIAFHGASPFTEKVFHVPALGTCDPGDVVSGNGNYPYTISRDGGMEADPAVIIRN